MSRRQATLFSLIGGATAQSTMWESWKNARMGRSTPWRATLGMPANSRAIQSGAVLFTVMEFHNIKKDAIRYGWHLKLQTKKYNITRGIIIK